MSKKTRAANRNIGQELTQKKAKKSKAEPVVVPVEKTSEAGQNNACPPDNAAVESSATSTVPEAIKPVSRSSAMEIKLTKRNVEKSGNVAYAQAGVRASVYFNKNMFAEGATPPSAITITVDGDVSPFALPGATKVVGPKLTKEERIANLEKARLARKNETPAQKAARLVAQAAKLIAKADKLK